MIDGVKIIKLTTHKDERGFFREIFRFPKQFSDVPVGQLSHSMVNEGIVKAWHGHVYQSQWNYVASGQIRAGLYDNRKDSETFRETMEFIIGEDSPIAYFSPPGILNGYKCLLKKMIIK